MFNNLVTYPIYKRDALPANDALAYQYVLAGNGVLGALRRISLRRYYQ
ncbi:MAG: hypothetical protein IT327_32425 [Anaerolineae bacterium]|nr:hypothetical protein [Anaerolineae bacterium]